MSFKLIAIRPLKDCDKKFRKNLKENHVYKFYNDYEFKHVADDIDNDIEDVRYISTIPTNLFDVTYNDVINGTKNISVNISAIVGRNGSGKSAISELLLYALFVISNKLRFIHKSHFLENSQERTRYEEDLKIIKSQLFAEFLYLHDGVLYDLQIKANTIKFRLSTLDSDTYTLGGSWSEITKRQDLFPFFYSIVTNYSFYGFNSNEIGMWIKSFFHKNDGYQMPIVINPYRGEGNININIETYLTRSRLLANILSIENYRDINTKSKISEIVLYRDEKKYNKYKYLDTELGKVKFSRPFLTRFKIDIIKPLYEKMFSYRHKGKEINAQYPDEHALSENSNKALAELYLVNKLITIPSRYNSFNSFDVRKDKKEDIEDNFDFDELNIADYIDELHIDRSHVTLKVRQTLNYIRKNIFEIPDFAPIVPLKLNEVVEIMKITRQENNFTELVDYLPPPFFFSEIIFEDESKFTHLSSGEKQQVFSLNSIIYHLKNIDSVHKSTPKNRNLIKYQSINLVFDEIELYFHPEFQKSYINNLLILLGHAQYDKIRNLNMIFLTHSPMILSDIPNQNIMYLHEGESLKEKDRPQKSFGANITDLLSDSFFFNSDEKILIGDFAKKKISQTLDWLRKNATQKIILNNQTTTPKVVAEIKYHKQIIELIDEPLVKNKLRDLYFDIVIDDEEYKNEHILRLERELNRLKN